MGKFLLIAGVLAIAVASVFLLKVREASRDAEPSVVQTRFDQVGDPLWEVPDFDLVSSDNQPVSKQDLRDKIWLAAFIFTRCPGPCPLITQRMAETQRRLDQVERFRLVSFTVDPAYDRPDVLRRYALEWNADSERWLFLTSPEPEDQLMLNLARDFKVAASRQPETNKAAPPDITHGTNMLLVDQEGWVRAIYDSADPDSPGRIAEGVRRLGEDPTN